jgi:hypothetical protein
MSRAAVVFVGAAAAAACGGSETTGGEGDAQVADGDTSDAPSDGSSIVDAQPDQSMLALYGPAPVDASADVDAGVIPIYGSAIIEGGILPKG